MNSTIISLIGISVIFTLAGIVIEHTPFKKSVKLIYSIIALLIIFSLFSPIITLIRNINFNTSLLPPEADENKYNELLIQDSGQKICAYTKEMLCKRFGINPDSIHVSATLCTNPDETVALEMITIKILKPLDFDSTLIAQAVSETLLCKCTLLDI